MSIGERTRIYEEFRKTDSRIKIDFGMDVLDVAIVVQWKILSNFLTWMQRADTAARGPDRVGEFIWIHPALCIGDRTSVPVTEPKPSQIRQIMNVKDKVESESELDED